MITEVIGTASQRDRWPGSYPTKEAVMRAVSTLVFGVALVSMAAPADAQTIVSRSISDQPVETTVTQGPNGAVVTRRILAEDDYATEAVPVGAPVVAADETVREVPVRRTTRTTTTRRISSRAGRTTRTVTRTIRRVSGRPLAMTPSQRDIVYRTIARERVIPGTPVTSEVVTTAEPSYRPWPYWGAPVVAANENYYDATVPAATTSVIYRVGGVLPESVPLFGVPESVAYRVPAVRRYSYADVGGRVYLVDPASSVIVADVTE
jgi:hypothetical protein